MAINSPQYYKNKKIMYLKDNILILYSQWDMGLKYKVYMKENGQYKYVHSAVDLAQAIDYVNKMEVPL